MKKNLSYPFYYYPGAPYSGYYDTEVYFKNLYRLQNTIINLITEIKNNSKYDNMLLHITIGAPYEEKYVGENNSGNVVVDDIGWQQLYPDHISNSKNELIHFIISPNPHFSEHDYVHPKFIKMTPELEWKYDGTKYINNNKQCVYVFCTPMPHIDKRKLNLKINQTYNDHEFIKKFYTVLSKLIDTVNEKNGIVTCFSFAVFNATTPNSKICNYEMFSEIKSLFGCSNKRLLAEWLYYDTTYVVYKYDEYDEYNKYKNMECDYDENNLISYIKKTSELTDGKHIYIDNNIINLI